MAFGENEIPRRIVSSRSIAQAHLVPALAMILCRAHPSSLFLKPQKWTDAALLLELHLEAAAGHDSRFAAPAGFIIQIDAVHVEAGTDLFDLPFFARQLFVEYLQKIHKCLAKITDNYFIKSIRHLCPGASSIRLQDARPISSD